MQYFGGKSFDTVNDIVSTSMAIKQARTDQTNRDLGMLQINNTSYSPPPAPVPQQQPQLPLLLQHRMILWLQ